MREGLAHKGGATPGLVVLSSIRKQAKQATKSKSVSMASLSVPDSRFPPSLSSYLGFKGYAY